MALPWRAADDGLLWLSVRATPRASKDAIEAIWLDADGQAWLGIKVRAAPDDGAANAAIVAVLAKALGLPKSAISQTSGATARLKRFKIVCNTYDIQTRLNALTGGRA